MPESYSRSRAAQPISRSHISTASHLALEKVIQDHIPTVTNTLRCLLSLLRSPGRSPGARHSLQCFEHDLGKLCVRAQEGVRKMDLELRIIESTWDRVDKQRWEVCRGDYKVVMALVQEVFEAGQMRMEEIGVAAAGTEIIGRTTAYRGFK